MNLESFYFGDPRLVLVPVEHLTPEGMDAAFAAALAGRGWSAEKVALFDRAFGLYWTRAEALSRRTTTWAPPRLRNVAVLADGELIPPYVQLLNTSTWTLYDCDFDPHDSDPELAAYLFAHGERMALSGEATQAALRNAAYWFDRSPAERSAFQQAARRSRRPDAAAFRALADAVAWLPQLGHETLRPVPPAHQYRPIPETGLLVPPTLVEAPPRLVDAWTAAANAALQRYHGGWRRHDAAALRSLVDWIAAAAPPLLVTGKGNRILWDADQPERVGPLRNELRRGGGEAVADIRRDLEVIAARTKAFTTAAVDMGGLPTPDESLAQDGYTYLYTGRKILAYNLHEPHLHRLDVPALPFARFMLGARATHEWAHLAVDAGWVCPVVPASDLAARLAKVVALFDAVLERAPEVLRENTRRDLEALRQQYAPALAHADEQALVGGDSAAAALTRMIVPRLADFKANLLAVHLQTEEEREAYVRQNIRALRGEYRAAERWRMLARYLYELQYLRFSAMANARLVFLRSTWFDTDFFASGALREEDFEALADAFAHLCDAYAIDADRFAVR